MRTIAAYTLGCKVNQYDTEAMLEAFERAGYVPVPFGEEADVYLINVFIQAILGDSAAKKYMIDVYRALDMSTVGLLAYRSILSGSHSVGIPNFRNAAEREAWRNDRHSTDSSISAGSDLLPSCKSGSVVADDAVYERVRQKFDAAPLTFGSH